MNLQDRFDSRPVLNGLLGAGALGFCALPWASGHVATAALVLVVWGICGWGALVQQQHRLVAAAPHVAPLVLALNNTATYGGLAASIVLGGFIILFVDPRYLSLVGAGLIVLAIAVAEAAHRSITRSSLIRMGLDVRE